MKKIIISFIFLTAFVMTAVHCDPTDAKEFHCPCRPESPPLVPDENDLIVPQIEEPPTNSSDTETSVIDDSDDEQFYGAYSSQDRSFRSNPGIPNSFDYCSELLATLFGRYERNGIDSISMIEIRPGIMYITRNNERISVDYTVEFRSSNGIDDSSIRFEIGEQTHRFELVIRDNSTYIIGLIRFMNGAMGLNKTQHYNATITNMGNNILRITIQIPSV